MKNCSNPKYVSVLLIFTLFIINALPVNAAPKKHSVGRVSEKEVTEVVKARSGDNDHYNKPLYIIGVDDVLNISVWRNQDLSVTVPVRPDGKISTPLVDDIRAAGLTPEALAAGIVVKLGEYIRDPHVTVIVTSVNSNVYKTRVRITGAVRNPTSIVFREGMTVLDVILDSGGLNEFASPNKAKLYRNTRSEIKVFNIRLKDILNKGILETNYALKPGDIITVPERLF